MGLRGKASRNMKCSTGAGLSRWSDAATVAVPNSGFSAPPLAVSPAKAGIHSGLSERSVGGIRVPDHANPSRRPCPCAPTRPARWSVTPMQSLSCGLSARMVTRGRFIAGEGDSNAQDGGSLF